MKVFENFCKMQCGVVISCARLHFILNPHHMIIRIDKSFSKLVIIVLAVFVFTVAEGRKIPGRIVDNNGNTMNVTFNVPFGFLSSTPNYEKIQFRIAYFDEANNKKVLKPDQARQISFTHSGEEIVMMSRVNTLDGGTIFNTPTHIFLRLQIDGKLKLFNYYSSSYSPGMYNAGTGFTSAGHMYSFSNFVLQLGEKEPLHPRGIGFRKEMMAYLRDCPDVVSLIESRELRRGDLEAIVMLYNKKCSGE